MAYLKKNTTLVLFFSVILCIGVLVFSILYYKNSFGRLNDALYSKERDIEKLSMHIDTLNSNISSLYDALDLQYKREENLSGLFSNLKSDKDAVETEKRDIEKKLNFTEAELFKAKIDLNLLEKNISDLRSQYTSLNNTLKKVLSDAEDICDDARALNLSKCRDY